MLLFTLDVHLQTSTSIRPLFNWLLQLLIAPLLSQLPILLVIPHLLQLLLSHVLTRVVIKVITLTLKLIYARILHRITSCVKCLKWMNMRTLLLIINNTLRLSCHICTHSNTTHWPLLILLIQFAKSLPLVLLYPITSWRNFLYNGPLRILIHFYLFSLLNTLI